MKEKVFCCGFISSEQGVKLRKGFTLIELLVVIAIIAMLMSILFPALRSAKQQAQVTLCLANNKQVGIIVTLFRTENDDGVPPVFNRWSGTVPVRMRLLSLAFRDYDPLTQGMPSELDPDGYWHLADDALTLRYYEDFLPDYYVCPFTRGKGASRVSDTGEIITIDGTPHGLQRSEGRTDTFSVWRWGGRGGIAGVRNTEPDPSNSPGRRLKYGNLSWQMWPDTGNPAEMANADKVLAKWDSKRARIVKTPLSDVTVAYCHQGESTDWAPSGRPSWIMNYNSHRKGQTGGTIALFTDSHAEWVPGDQIGWP